MQRARVRSRKVRRLQDSTMKGLPCDHAKDRSLKPWPPSTLETVPPKHLVTRDARRTR